MLRGGGNHSTCVLLTQKTHSFRETKRNEYLSPTGTSSHIPRLCFAKAGEDRLRQHESGGGVGIIVFIVQGREIP